MKENERKKKWENYSGGGLLCFTGSVAWVQKGEYIFVAYYQAGSFVMA